MAQQGCRCTVRGSINHDEYFHVERIVRPGETISSQAHESQVGGKGANQAVAIVRAGGIAHFYGTIGGDGTWVTDRMKHYGIDVGGIIVSDADPTGRAIIQVAADGENSIVLFPGANHSELHERRFMQESQGFFPETSHLLLQNEIHPRSMDYALDNARNATVIYNPSPLPSDQEISRFPWNKIDWLIVNEAEAAGICRSLHRSRTNTTATMSTRERVFLLSAHPSFSTTNIVCTLGGDGVLAFIPTFHRPKTAHEAPSFMHLPAARLQGDVRDTTGAGDCFTGYFVQGLMEFGPYAKVGKTIREQEIARILKTSVYAAGMCVERRGTIESIPTRAQVEARMSVSPQG